MKSDFSQMRLSRSGFDSEREAFRAELILNEIKQVGFIWLIGCVIMNALKVLAAYLLSLSTTNSVA